MLISSLIAFTPHIIAKFITNAHIFSPLNISFTTINIIITEIMVFSLSKVLCYKLIFLCLYFSTNSLNVFGADNNSSSKSSDCYDIGRICSCLVILWKKGISKVLINSSK